LLIRTHILFSLFSAYRAHRDLHSFPTRRSSDLEISAHTDSKGSHPYNQRLSNARAKSVVDYLVSKGIKRSQLIPKGYAATQPVRSEEHTSELQSRENLVCRLLLEKKKKKKLRNH